MERSETINVYRPLNVEKREIRVLEILSKESSHMGQKHSKVAVELHHCSLDDPINYEALSYTWGDPSKTAIICLGSNKKFIDNFIVRQNLESALRDLQLPTENRFIWIDALCINQEDFAERSDQVKLMQSIYANATVVRSWLDLKVDTASQPLIKLESFSKNTSVQDLGDDAEFWTPVGKILTNEYWFRIWVQQELAYAREWTLQCRDSEISSKCLMKFAVQLVMKIWGFYTDPLLDKSKWKALMPTFLRPLLYRSRREDGAVEPSTFYGPLNRALRECRDLRSTDPRDKIFAMLGMIDGYQDGDIEVDYTSPVEQVYMDVVKLFIDRYRSLDFLREAVFGNTGQGHKHFPTWLPDWSQHRLMDSFESPASSVTSLNANSHLPVSSVGTILPLKCQLEVSGVCLGRLALLHPEVQQERLWKAKHDFTDLLAKLRLFKLLGDQIVPPESTEPMTLPYYVTSYLFRALTAADGRGIDEPRFQLYVSIFADLISTSSLENKDEACAALLSVVDRDPTHFGDIVHYMQGSCRGRHFFLTSDGHMGLAPHSAVLDDEIWYLVGLSTPIFLRPKGDVYVVVGEAYLNGFMQWSLADGAPTSPNGMPMTGYQFQAVLLC